MPHRMPMKLFIILSGQGVTSPDSKVAPKCCLYSCMQHRSNFGPDATGPLTASYGVDTSGAFTTKLRAGQVSSNGYAGYGPGFDQDDF